MGVVKKIELGVDALSNQDVFNNTIMIDLSGHQAGQVKIIHMQEEIIRASEGKLKLQDIEQHWRTETPFQFFFLITTTFNAALLHGKKSLLAHKLLVCFNFQTNALRIFS